MLPFGKTKLKWYVPCPSCVDSKSNPVDGLSRGQLAGPWQVESSAFPGVSLFELCGQSSDGERALEPTRCWRCSSVRVGARQSTATGSARWFPYPTNTWEPLLLTWVVWVSVRIDEPCASIGVRMENVQQSKRAKRAKE